MQGNGMPQGFNMQPNPSNGQSGGQLPQMSQWTPESVSQMMQNQPRLIPEMIKAWSEGRLNESQANAVRQIIPILQAQQRGQQPGSQLPNMPPQQQQQMQNMAQSEAQQPLAFERSSSLVCRHWHTTSTVSGLTTRWRDTSAAATYAKPWSTATTAKCTSFS